MSLVLPDPPLYKQHVTPTLAIDMGVFQSLFNQPLVFPVICLHTLSMPPKGIEYSYQVTGKNGSIKGSFSYSVPYRLRKDGDVCGISPAAYDLSHKYGTLLRALQWSLQAKT